MARKILSIFFHNVLAQRDPHDPYHAKQVTGHELPVLLEYLKSRYTPINVDTFLDLYLGWRRHRFRRPPVLVSFDDGHLGTFVNGGAVLADLKVPAVVFVLGGVLTDPNRVPLYIEWFYLVRHARRRRGEFRGRPFCLETPEGYASLRRRTERGAVHQADPTAREDFVEELAEVLDVRRPRLADLPADLAYVTPRQLRDYPGQEFLSVGSHAMSHLPLSVLGADEQRRELRDSHDVLTALAPTYNRTVSYPFGDHDVGARASASGLYRFGFAVEAGAHAADPFAYPRTCIAVHGLDRFRYTLSRRRRWLYAPARSLLSKVGLSCP